MLFISFQKLFLFLRYLNVCLNFLGHAEKRLNQKVKSNFRIDVVIKWEINEYNAHIA